MTIEEIIENGKVVNLDIGCGGNKQPGFIGMDKRPLDGVDIVHDLEVFPYPIPDGICNTVVGSHIAEHIVPFSTDPRLIQLVKLLIDKKILSENEVLKYCGVIDDTPKFIAVFNEIWRILKVGGKLALAFPYGVGHGFVQDPTHINAINETTFEYFDPNFFLYRIYNPKPWAIEHRSWQVGGFMEVVLRKVEEVKNAE